MFLIFARIMWALCLGQSFSTQKAKKEPSPHNPTSTSLFSLVSLFSSALPIISFFIFPFLYCFPVSPPSSYLSPYIVYCLISYQIFFYFYNLRLICHLMPKNTDSPVFGSTPSYGVGVFEDAKARLKHQALMQDYQELQREVDAMRSKLEVGKQRKMMLATETRFLRSRYEYFMKAKIGDSSRKGKLVVKPAKPVKEFSRKEANQYVLPPLPDPKPKKKKQYIGKEVAPSGVAPVYQQHRRTLRVGKEQSLTLISDVNHNGRIDTRRKNLVRTPVLDLNQKDRLHTNDTALRHTFLAFDLNQDNSSSGKEASVPTRASFDLNEISTGDEDFHSTVEAGSYEEAKRSLTRLSNDEVQNDLMLAICRNAGEGPSRVGKRKISWQDPVALRV